MTIYIYAMMLLLGLSIVIGTTLSILSLSSKNDISKEEKIILDLLPNINCGACSYPNCYSLAHEMKLKRITSASKCKVIRSPNKEILQEFLDKME